MKLTHLQFDPWAQKQKRFVWVETPNKVPETVPAKAQEQATAQSLEAIDAETKKIAEKEVANATETIEKVTNEPTTVTDDTVEAAQKTHDELDKALTSENVGSSLERFFQKMTELFERLSVWLSGNLMPKKQTEVPQFQNSLFGTQKIIIKKTFEQNNKKGVDLAAENPGSDVTAVRGGKIIETGGTDQNKFVKVDAGGVTMLYTHVDSALTIGQEIKEGTVLGKVQDEALNFQITKDNGDQIDPEPFLKKYIKVEEPKVETPVPVAAATEVKVEATATKTETPNVKQIPIEEKNKPGSEKPTAAAKAKSPDEEHRDIEAKLDARVELEGARSNIIQAQIDSNNLLDVGNGQTALLQVPYLKENSVDVANCVITGSVITIGQNIYEMTLPTGELQSIQFIERGKGTKVILTSRTDLGPVSEETDAQAFFIALENIQNGNIQNFEMGVSGSKFAKFNKMK